MSIVVELTDHEWQELQGRRNAAQQQARYGSPFAAPRYGQCEICGNITHQTTQHSMYQPAQNGRGI